MTGFRSALLSTFSTLFAVWLMSAAMATAAPMVWSGLTTNFTKNPFEIPLPVDQITPSVGLTRGSSQGLYNASQEGFFSSYVSPADTEWATSYNNPTETISATNWAALTFADWTSAYGGGGLLATNITQLDAVVHLITDDIYLDLRFTSWDSQPPSGTGFSYLRSTPEPASILLLAVGALLLMAGRRAARHTSGFAA